MRHYLDAIDESDFVDAEDDDDEPHCSDCGCHMFSEEHSWDCAFYGEDEDEDGETD